MYKSLLAAVAGIGLATSAYSQVYITEYMYDTTEFVEFTNLGPTAVDLTGWTFDDADTFTPFSLSALGTIDPGESVIVTQSDVAAFRTAWGLDNSVQVVSYGTGALQRADSVVLRNSSNVVVDQLDYGDNTIGGPRTNLSSAWTSFNNLGDNAISQWVLSANLDAQGSHANSGGTGFGSPGTYVVPEPTTAALMMISGVALLGWKRRRNR